MFNITNFIMPTIPEMFHGALDILIYVLSIMGAISVVLLGSLIGLCFVITFINIIINLTFRICKGLKK
jgi:hypothetical protein